MAMYHETMKLPRFNFSTFQLLLLTALVALGIALGTTIYQRVRRMARPVGAAWSVDGKLAAVRFTDGSIRIWNDGGRPLAKLNTGDFWALWTTTPMLAIIDTKHLATTDSSGKIDVWDVDKQQRITSFRGNFASPNWESASISRDGRRVASVRVGGQPGIDIWDVQQGARSQKISYLEFAQRIALSDDGSRLAILGHEGSLRLMNAADGQLIGRPITLLTPSVDRNTVALSGDLSTVAIALREEIDAGSTPVIVGSLVDGAGMNTTYVSGDIETLSLSSDGKILATASALGDVALRETAAGKQLCSLSLPVDESFMASLDLGNSPKVAMSISPDGKSLLAGTNTTLGIYDVATGKMRANLGVVPTRLGRFFFIPAFLIWAMLWGRATCSKSKPVASAEGATVQQVKPPRAMVAVWIMLFIGGVWGIVWAMIVLFSDFTCLALTPFPYYGLFVGVRAAAAATGRARREFGLTGIAISQIFAFIAGDMLNPMLGLVNVGLLQQESVKRYRST